jgi:glutamate dehydrogenase/leucine dehydrogenase
LTGLKISESTVAIQGFGAVGQHAARYLAEQGATLVSVSDSKHTLVQSSGMDVEAVIQYKNDNGKLEGYENATLAGKNDIINVHCDIWIPAARPDIVTMKNVADLNCKMIVQGANIPISVDAEEALHAKGTTIIPDYIANAGGVICASVEYHQGTEKDAMTSIVEKISRNTQQILRDARALDISPRQAADKMTQNLLTVAMNSRRWHLPASTKNNSNQRLASV